MSRVVHLVVGSTGAGKSTYASKLAAERGAVRFAVDDWMRILFADDRPEDAGFDWFMERITRSSELIWKTSCEMMDAGVSVVLEVGLTRKADRDAFYERAEAEGRTIVLHCVDAPRELRWKRVEQRNRDRGATFAIEVSREMFDFVETMWERPEEEELRRYSGVVVEP